MNASIHQEIPDDTQAPAGIQALYRDIRATLGSGVVNLVFRRLATQEPRLRQVWERLRPEYRHGTFDRLAATLLAGTTPPAPRPVPEPSGLTSAEISQIQAVLRTYNANNARNFLAFTAVITTAVKRRHPGEHEPREAVRPPALPIPPLPAWNALPEPIRNQTLALNALGNHDDKVMPGLYRHLALWPSILPPAARILAPLAASGYLQQERDALITRAQALVNATFLPASPQREPLADIRPLVGDLVAHTLPRMIPVGLILEQAFANEPND